MLDVAELSKTPNTEDSPCTNLRIEAGTASNRDVKAPGRNNDGDLAAGLADLEADSKRSRRDMTTEKISYLRFNQAGPECFIQQKV